MDYSNNQNLDSDYVPVNVPHLNSFTKVVVHANKRSHEHLKQAAVAKKLDLQRLAVTTIHKGSKGGFYVLNQQTQKKTYIPKNKVQQMKRKLSLKSPK